MKMALEGVRVVEWGLFMQGPVAARILGSLGAEVIKIEDPRRGDPSRHVPKRGVPGDARRPVRLLRES